MDQSSSSTSSSESGGETPSPKEIFEHLNGVIVGHYVMKKALCVSVFNHYRDEKLMKR